jgi:hypothetical protein
MFPNYRRTAAQRCMAAAPFLVGAAVLIAFAFWGFVAYTVGHFAVKYW